MFAGPYLTLLIISTISLAQNTATYIRNADSGKLLDVDGASVAPGASVVLGDGHSGANKEWLFDSGYLVNRRSGLVLEIPGQGSVRPGTVLQQAGLRKIQDADRQLWTHDDQYRIISAYDRTLCVWCQDKNVCATGAKIVVDTCIFNEPTQQWMFDPV
ncbi:ricin B-like lectin [Macrolepiota fuliginosa MF-IS2]|uniref:Ricin B-like lectin n=1 Tax=Macrolepiota fuliginosa MF-IS2 TaxID=1400762 RepID=A0A9P5X541_9AGAR|nr:ricin B-like lectin [Macrolepiota fuliginosa MF-IS2]